jgi:uncharacterized protein YndB with AHSA1/START domain
MGGPHEYEVSYLVRADPETVWDVISDHAGMTQWTPFRRVVLEHQGTPHPNGVGALRALYLIGPPTREEVVEFAPPRRLRYRLRSGLPFDGYEGEITVEPDGPNSRLTARLRFRTRIPGTQVFGPLAIRLATRGALRLAERRSGRSF